jgi:flagellar biosynthesis/type III secretory pathway M-ring protein FliF/YscJ
MRKRQIAQGVDDATREQPENVAALLRTWMSQSEE